LKSLILAGRARSGIIVLPCGAGKSLVGVSAACRIRKSVLCLATNAVSVDQWAFQFKLWSTVQDHQISRFTSDSKERFRGSVGVVVTTYNMVAFGGKRSEESQKIIEEIQNREWGLLLMDEVPLTINFFWRYVSHEVYCICRPWDFMYAPEYRVINLYLTLLQAFED
jgi:DNA excision repair protein ERCC-3